jgi:hypothetical protein
MVWPFGSKTFLEPEVEAWHFDTWAWLLQHLGGVEQLKAGVLVLPRAEFFPASEATGHERALFLFEQVKALAGMEGWPATLSAQPDYVQDLGRYMVVKPGTTDPIDAEVGADAWEALVTYNPLLLSDPASMVATLAHELAHYRLGYIEEPPPGGGELMELATDLTMVFMGFGVFGAKTASRFMGTGTQWEGYLSPRGWAFGLAAFLLFRDEAVEPLRPHLDVWLYNDLRKALDYLQRHPERLASAIR